MRSTQVLEVDGPQTSPSMLPSFKLEKDPK